MNKYLDCSNATVYAASNEEFMGLAKVFGESLLRECEFFAKISTHAQPDHAFLSDISIQEFKQHLHQLLGFLPIFCAKDPLNEVIIFTELVKNSSSTDFPFPLSRLKEILEGLQGELKMWAEIQSLRL